MKPLIDFLTNKSSSILTFLTLLCLIGGFVTFVVSNDSQRDAFLATPSAILFSTGCFLFYLLFHKQS